MDAFREIILALPLMAMVPLLVRHYLGNSFARSFRHLVVVGGIGWLVYAFFNETLVYRLLGLTQMDALGHWGNALKIADDLAMGRWPIDGIVLSNEAYRFYLGVVHFLTGASDKFAVCINAFFAFWGGLALSRALTTTVPAVPKSQIWFLVIIFFPSTVFWTTANLKEGFMYWAVCLMISTTAQGIGTRSKGIYFWPAVATSVAAVFRPHVCAAWIIACGTVELFQKGKRIWALMILLAALPLSVMTLERIVGKELASVGDAMGHLERTADTLSRAKGGSNIEYGESGPIFFVSGFVAVFFRPFPWDITSTRVLVTAVETWSVTLLLLFGWLRLNGGIRRTLLGLPLVQASILGCIAFSIFFTFIPNEGLMVRQRVQVVPALLILTSMPYLTMHYLRWRAQAYAAAAQFRGATQ